MLVAYGIVESSKATLWHRSASVQFVTSSNCSGYYRWERRMPGEVRSHWKQHLCRHTEKCNLGVCAAEQADNIFQPVAKH